MREQRLYRRGRTGKVSAYGPDVFETEANPVVYGGILSQDFAGSSVSDYTRGHLLEDMVRHSMAKESTEVDLIQTHLLRNLSKRGSLIDRECLC
jgi:hypothetical protein